jgi:hypothetical protein
MDSPVKTFFTVSVLILSGCSIQPASVAVIDYYDYGAMPPRLFVLPEQQIHVEDLRVEVLSHDKEPGYVGTAEDGFGDRRTVKNTDGCPLPHSVHATQNCKSFADSVKSRLVDASSVGSASDGVLYVLINDWHTDAIDGLKLYYDLTAVYHQSGQIVERSHIKGSGETIDTRAIAPMNFVNHEEAEQKLSMLLVQTLDKHLKALLSGPISRAIRQTADKPHPR